MHQFSSREINLRIILSVLIALLFTTIPLVDAVNFYRPLFIPLVVLYWAIFHPINFGLGKSLLIGLSLEVMQSLLIGQASIGLICISFFALSNSRRLQLAAVPQQMLTVLFLLLFFQFTQVWIESILDRPSDYYARGIAALISATLWPGIIYFMRGLILRKKNPPK